jgi:uncharacterized membrane protein YfcA
VIAALLGLLVGLVLGLTGAGGSAIAVPLLMWGLGWTLLQAAPVALLAVSVSSALGAYHAWRKAYVRYRAAGLMAAAALLTTPAAVWLAPRLPLAALTWAFAGILALIGLRMIRQARRHPDETVVMRATVAGEGPGSGGPVCRRNPRTGRLQWTQPCFWAVSATGAITGVLAGLFGVGGGFVVVPALRAYSDLSMQSAVATSLMAIALISGLAVLMNLMHGQGIMLAVAAPFVAGALAGMLASRRLAPHLPASKLQQGFGALLIAVAAMTALRVY